MRRVWAAIVVYHIIRIAVVGDDDGRIAVRQASIHHGFHANIYRFAGFYGGFKYARVAHHIGIGKVQTHKINGLLFQFRHNRIPNSKGRHFGLEVISCYLRRGAKQAGFALKRSFSSSRKEKRDVRIFFSFGNSCLLFSSPGQYLTKRIGQVVFVKNHRNVLETIVIIGHRDVFQVEFGHVLLRKIALAEGLRNLAASVGPKIKTQHHVPVLNGSQGRAVGF